MSDSFRQTLVGEESATKLYECLCGSLPGSTSTFCSTVQISKAIFTYLNSGVCCAFCFLFTKAAMLPRVNASC